MSVFDDINPGFSGDPLEVFVAVRTMVDKPAWHGDALCREHPHLPWVVETRDTALVDQMRSICARCSVRDECAADVELHTFTTVGVWSGQTRQDRARGKRGLSRPNAA